jgi:hypothetical protein
MPIGDVAMCKERKLAAWFLYSVSGVARGNVVGWGTMLQAGRSRVQFPMRSLDFSFDLIRALGSTQFLTEISTRNLPGSKGRPAPKADNLTALCDPIV